MNPREILDWKLEPALRECRLHERRMTYALAQLAGKLPVTAEQWADMDDETVTDVDQLLFRYNKLQDAMGQRLFPAILMLGGDWSEDQTFLDRPVVLQPANYRFSWSVSVQGKARLAVNGCLPLQEPERCHGR